MSDEKINPEEFFKTLNGFEEVAIERTFLSSAAELAIKADSGNTFPLMRSLLFVQAKRGGMKDGEAFRYAMNMTALDVSERFETPQGGDGEGKAQEPTETRPTPPSSSAPASPSPWMSTSL
jgi:hypothetical protein